MSARTPFLSVKASFHVRLRSFDFLRESANLTILYSAGQYEYYNINPAPVPTLADCQELVSEVQGFNGSTLHASLTTQTPP